MSEPINEAMSALVDGEANEIDRERVVKALTAEHGDASALRSKWARLHSVQAILAESNAANLADFGSQVQQITESKPASDGYSNSPEQRNANAERGSIRCLDLRSKIMNAVEEIDFDELTTSEAQRVATVATIDGPAIDDQANQANTGAPGTSAERKQAAMAWRISAPDSFREKSANLANAAVLGSSELAQASRNLPQMLGQFAVAAMVCIGLLVVWNVQHSPTEPVVATPSPIQPYSPSPYALNAPVSTSQQPYLTSASPSTSSKPPIRNTANRAANQRIDWVELQIGNEVLRIPRSRLSLATQQRLREYLVRHAQNASLNSGQGNLPLVTVPQNIER